MKSLSIILVVLLALIQINSIVCLTPRTITIVNQCTEDYHWMVTAGSDAGKNCSTGCDTWSSCNTANGLCYFNPPTYNGTLGFVSAGQTVELSFYNYGSATLWSGNIGFCQSGANCYSSDQSIYLGVGIISNDLGPSNLAEITMLNNDIDYYDLSNINGISAPFQFGPSIQNGCTNNGNPYFCGVAGTPNPINSQLPPAFWNISSTDVSYRWVIPTSDPAVTCSQDNTTCPSGLVCGLNITYATSTPQLVCGIQYGWWTADQICAASPATTLFDCNNDYTYSGNSIPYSNLYGCTDVGTSGSCYTFGADSECCGCANWNDILGYQVTPPITMPCQNTNSYWTTTVLPTLTWVKETCPTCYSYPYDDKSSTFTCAIYDNNGYNNQNYTITLCPVEQPSTPQQAADPSECPYTTFICGYTNYSDIVYYNPTEYICYDNQYLCPTATSICILEDGSYQCYDPTTASCSNGIVCGGGVDLQACIFEDGSHACYDPQNYCCIDGTLQNVCP